MTLRHTRASLRPDELNLKRLFYLRRNLIFADPKLRALMDLRVFVDTDTNVSCTG